MNQILYTIENEEEKNRMRSIILFFAITIIIFGVIMTAMGGYRIVSAKIAKEEAKEAAKVPNVELSLEEETNNAVIKVNHIRNIKEISYSWNNGEKTTLEQNDIKEIEEHIELPSGTNTLNVTVTDIEGKQTTKTKDFTYNGTYMEVSIIDNVSIKITVTDMSGLQSVAYKWNEGEEITSYPEETDSTIIEITADIPVGTNTLNVKAVNNENKTEEKEVKIQGISKPTMKINFNSDRTLLIMQLNDDQGIQSYTYTLSSAPIADIAKDGKIIPEFKEKLHVVTSQTKDGGEQNSIREELQFQEGFNYLEVKITNIEGVEETFSGWCAK